MCVYNERGITIILIILLFITKFSLWKMRNRVCINAHHHSLSRVVVPATQHNISVPLLTLPLCRSNF